MPEPPQYVTYESLLEAARKGDADAESKLQSLLRPGDEEMARYLLALNESLAANPPSDHKPESPLPRPPVDTRARLLQRRRRLLGWSGVGLAVALGATILLNWDELKYRYGILRLHQEMEFVRVPGGTFEMGCGVWDKDCDDDEQPTHQVTVDAFELGKYEVTKRQWKTVMGIDPSRLSCEGECPVENIARDDVQGFVNILNAMGGPQYRLPTEAEWEYACRSGGKPEIYAGGSDVEAVAWIDGNSNWGYHPVGQKAPNGLGLYDMSGNLPEWVQDRGIEPYTKEPQINPLIDKDEYFNLHRGGSYSYEAKYARCTDRGGMAHDIPIFATFRLVRIR